MAKKVTVTREQHEALSYENPHIISQQSQDKFGDEPQKGAVDKGGNRDLLAEALEKWETFNANECQPSGTGDQQ
jgi:hypothetical protein